MQANFHNNQGLWCIFKSIGLLRSMFTEDLISIHSSKKIQL
jgi:hypothetical protein